jgi:alanyl-tRNA synthetase
MMKIISESSVAAGIRRIEAVTGRGAEKYVNDLQKSLNEAARALKASPGELADKAKKLVEQLTSLEKELKKARRQGARQGMTDLMERVKDVNGIKVLAAKVDAPDRKTLGEWAEHYRDRLGEGACVLGSVIDEKVVLIAAVSKSLTPKVHAGNIVKHASEIVGGKGGGRPDFAQGGGMDASKLDAALRSVEKALK